MPKTALIRIGRAVIASLLVGVVGWRLVAAGHSEIARLQDPERIPRRDLLVADLQRRSEWTLGPDHALHRILRERIPEGSIVVLYTSVGEAVIATQHRMVQLHNRLLSLLYPMSVTVCFGSVPDEGAYLSRLDPRFFIVNVTPDDPIPLEPMFDRQLDGDGFSLWRFRGAP